MVGYSERILAVVAVAEYAVAEQVADELVAVGLVLLEVGVVASVEAASGAIAVAVVEEPALGVNLSFVSVAMNMARSSRCTRRSSIHLSQ